MKFSDLIPDMHQLAVDLLLSSTASTRFAPTLFVFRGLLHENFNCKPPLTILGHTSHGKSPNKMTDLASTATGGDVKAQHERKSRDGKDADYKTHSASHRPTTQKTNKNH